MSEERESVVRKILIKRVIIGVSIALVMTFVARTRERWEGVSAMSSTNIIDDVAIPIASGILAGLAYHWVSGTRVVGRARYYLAWVLAATMAAVPVLLPDLRNQSSVAILWAAPAFGIVVGIGWAIFLRRIGGHDY